MHDLLRISELAKILKISESGLRALVRQGVIPCIKLGPRSIRFDPEAIDHWRRQFFETSSDNTHSGVETA